MIIVQMPQTCSRQLMSQTGGVVCLPSTVTGFLRISINAEITFRFRRYGSSNVSQYAVAPSFSRRWILNLIDFGGFSSRLFSWCVLAGFITYLDCRRRANGLKRRRPRLHECETRKGSRDL